MHGPARLVARFDTARIIAWREEGLADLVTGARPDLETRFRWFSVTKLVTATAALALVDEGLLRLDEPLEEAAGATLEELLSHGSGLPDPSPLPWVHPPGASRRSPGVLTRALLDRHAPRRAPGTVRYTNLGYLALAERLARASGRPFADLLAARVLGPAGMRSTGFAPSPAAVGHEALLSPRTLAMSALFFPRSLRFVRYLRGGWVGLAPFELEGEGYGGLVGSMRDLVRFGRLHLRDGELDGRRVLSAARARDMREPRNASFALGFERFGGGWLGHEGQAGGYRAALRLHPERGIGHAVLAASGTASLDAE